MSKLPDWLPDEVAFHIQTLLNTGGLGTTEKTLHRLAFDREMAKVWKTLQPLSDDPHQLIDYLEFIRLHQAVMDWPTNFLDVPGDAVQRRAFNMVAASCETTLNAMAKLSNKRDPQRGWGLLEDALQRNEQMAFAQGDADKLLDVVNIRAHLREIQQSSNAVEILETIKQVALLAASAPDMSLPRKRGAFRADIVCLATDLSRYVQLHFHKPLHEVVARTVNVALHLHEQPISADSVRKLNHS